VTVAVMQLLMFGLGIAGAIVGSVFHATTAIVLSGFLFFSAFLVERSKS